MAEYSRPYLYRKQFDAMFCQERYALIEASTKSGKTVSAIAWFLEQGFSGKETWNYWWIAPGYNQAEIAYRRIKGGLTKSSFVAFDTPTPRITLMNGACLWFKSADNPDALYGEDVYAAVIDEASRVGEASWHAVRSTLTATRGPLRIIGNVKGRKNWFYDLARRAEAMMLDQPDVALRSMHYAKITADDAVEAGVLAREEIEDARDTLPEGIFRELYYAEPSDDSGNPFGLNHINACAVADLAPGPPVAFGVDLAKKQDWLVVIGLNELGQVCVFRRWRSIPWRNSIERIWGIVGDDTKCLVDSTGLGDPVLEELQHEHGNFQGYHFSLISKQKLMEGLSVSIQGHEIEFPKGLISQELESFEYEYTKTGVRYSAPEGRNDDCVAALALARQMWAEIAPGDNVMAYYAQASLRAKRVPNGDADEPKPNNRPWRDEAQPDQTLDNELNDLYNDTVRHFLPDTERYCYLCHKPVSRNSRVTDGEYVWHPECCPRSGVTQRSPELTP